MSSSTLAAPTQQGRARYWLSAWLPVLVAILLVAIESTPAFGSDRTSGPLRQLWEWLFGAVSDHAWHILHALIRKSGHFTGFGLVGLTWFRAWRMTLAGASFLRVEILAMIGTALVASADEYHQSFLPNRTASLRDVLLDCVGALVTIAVAHQVLKRRVSMRRLDKEDTELTLR
ncbi:MAG TPA: VanZ family protein [Terracidiphilus sp.]|nr:VanZ family protein [Terracidiphilus sp.]